MINSTTTSLAGATELLEAIRQLSTQPGPDRRIEVGTLTAVLTASEVGNRPSISHPAGPVHFYHAQFLPEADPPSRYSLHGRPALVLHAPADCPPSHAGWSNWPVVVDGDRTRPGTTLAGASGPVPLVDALRTLPAVPDIVLLAIDGSRLRADCLLGSELEQVQALLNALFVVCKELYEHVQSGKTRVAAIVCNRASPGAELHPVAGLFGGFIKSLARELPKASVAAINTDTPLANLFEAAELALAERKGTDLPELSLRDGIVSRAHLVKTPAITRSGSAPLVGEGMVVLATGGARGVTAVLLEELVSRYRCKVVALGRTVVENTPRELLAMSEPDLASHESAFYRDALARDGKKKIVELKSEFRRHVAANEIFHNRERFRELGGNLEYIVADITQQEDVSDAIEQVLALYGRIDLVVHGAGLQISRAMPGKSVTDFDSIVTAKLAGLRNIYSALVRRGVDQHVGFHLVSSAFSFWGNEGQPDYGAANEAMNGLAAAMTAAGRRWTSLAWPGWAGVGMTRGSEYASLAVTRDLYPVTKREGQALFAQLIQGKPVHPANILASHKELKFYNLQIAGDVDPEGTSRESLDLSLGRNLYLGQHLVAGVPTMPGAVELMYSVRAALRVTGKTPGVEVRGARFASFLKSYPSRQNQAHVVVEQDSKSPGVRVRIESDFIHPNGLVLRKDVLNFAADVSPVAHAPDIPPEVRAVAQSNSGFALQDPYVSGDGVVALYGIFDCLRDITINELGQVATIELSPALLSDPNAALLARAVLLDALWRLSAMRPVDDHVLLYVPIMSNKLTLWMQGADLPRRLQNARLMATRPTPVSGIKGRILIPHAVAVDAQGNVLAVNEGLLAQANV